MLTLPNITRIYLNELSTPETASLPIKLLKLIIEPENTAPDLARELAAQVRSEIPNIAVRESFIDLLETIIVYKLPQKSREEIAAMFNLSDLKKTRVYQEILEEVQAEAQVEIAKAEAKTAKAQTEAQEAKQREKASILRMANRGLPAEEIATFLDVPLTEVEATIAEAQQN